MSEILRIPIHVSIIMDGNGRWAKMQGKERLFGHYEGAESVRACTEYAVEKGIKYLSLFAFSSENWSRPKDEVMGLMALMIKSVTEEQSNFMQNNIRFLVIGDRTHLSEELRNEIDKAQRLTEANTGLTLIVFLSYSGKWDILQATQRYAVDYAKGIAEGRKINVDENSYEKYLSTSGIPDPDLLIRTSGEQRISNYLLWQCAYTEFYFTEILWPDFRKKEFEDAIRVFSNRERRFGKVIG